MCCHHTHKHGTAAPLVLLCVPFPDFDDDTTMYDDDDDGHLCSSVYDGRCMYILTPGGVHGPLTTCWVFWSFLVFLLSGPILVGHVASVVVEDLPTCTWGSHARGPCCAAAT